MCHNRTRARAVPFWSISPAVDPAVEWFSISVSEIFKSARKDLSYNFIHPADNKLLQKIAII